MNPGSEVPSIGIDVGGTFTDFVAAIPAGGLVFHKEPSTPDDPSIAVQRGLLALKHRHVAIDAPGTLIVHGTTIALNAVLQRKVASAALVVSTGTRDVLEIARGRMPSSFNFLLGKEVPIIPRDRVIEVGARSAADGSVLSRPDLAELDAVADRIGELGVEAVAIMLLHSYVDPILEKEVASHLARRLPSILFTLSSRVWPEIREYERAVVACINAQVHPLMERYLATLMERIETAGARCSTLQLTSSSGGVLSLRTARERPVETLFSGPASGVMAAVKLSEELGIDAGITFDVGGTSADVAILGKGRAAITSSVSIGDLPIMLPVIGVSSIGAGGGSIVSVDELGIIKVGPESAGARPGPVAYGLGGERPTVTDCYVATGVIAPDTFLDGRMRLDRAAADAALERIAERLGLASAAEAGEAALRVATVQMATYLFKLLAQKGLNPAEHVLVPFGGAGPTHANFLAREAGLAGVTVPPAASTFCALGAILADLRRDYVRSLPRMNRDASKRVFAAWTELDAEAEEWLSGEGIRVTGRRPEYGADMRYAGQSHNITVAIAPEARLNEDFAAVREAFHREHERIYGFRESDDAVEIVTVRLSMIGHVPAVHVPRQPVQNPAGTPAPRRLFLDGTWHDALAWRRESLVPCQAVPGPAVVEMQNTTVLILPGWEAEGGPLGQLAIRQRPGRAA